MCRCSCRCAEACSEEICNNLETENAVLIAFSLRRSRHGNVAVETVAMSARLVQEQRRPGHSSKNLGTAACWPLASVRCREHDDDDDDLDVPTYDIPCPDFQAIFGRSSKHQP
jgi:hypothetical protein